MDRKDGMLSQIRQTEKDKDTTYMWNLEKLSSETESKLLVNRGLGWEN